MELIEKAKRLLGTTETTETIHKALEDATRWVLLRQLANQDFSDLTPDVLTKLRRGRLDRL
jgi:Arc/MetJ family transcription regulator